MNPDRSNEFRVMTVVTLPGGKQIDRTVALQLDPSDPTTLIRARRAAFAMLGDYFDRQLGTDK